MWLVVKKFGVQDEICGILTDNASNNSSMMAEIKKFKWPKLVKYSKDTSTCDHKDPDDINDSEDDTDETIEMELSIEDIHDPSDEDEEQDSYTSVLCKETFPQVSSWFHAIVCKLRKSPNLKAEFVQLFEEQECNDRLIWQKDQKYGLARRLYHINRINIQLAQDLIAILNLFYKQTLQVSTLGSA
ncbi:hypothetical protein PSTG_00440 [Puccinia striiformis f. sp. tritici PST-78]|uniref:DUF659 domain-containing protein n=1 Tax=Puccinia striiformis f. sp. tritici PST-78 TaxID=1165861 RepID=A0A0L0W534_9BASI|nr:hypothetical protein PSTG_00440 [Puccinia striiformis f. sp. tritici PST-78]